MYCSICARNTQCLHINCVYVVSSFSSQVFLDMHNYCVCFNCAWEENEIGDETSYEGRLMGHTRYHVIPHVMFHSRPSPVLKTHTIMRNREGEAICKHNRCLSLCIFTCTCTLKLLTKAHYLFFQSFLCSWIFFIYNT